MIIWTLSDLSGFLIEIVEVLIEMVKYRPSPSFPNPPRKVGRIENILTTWSPYDRHGRETLDARW